MLAEGAMICKNSMVDWLKTVARSFQEKVENQAEGSQVSLVLGVEGVDAQTTSLSPIRSGFVSRCDITKSGNLYLPLSLLLFTT